MSRFWTSWYTKTKDDPEDLPFPVWWTGGTFDDPPEFTVCAMIDAYDEKEAEDIVSKLYPDCRMRFCNPHDASWEPPQGRFPK